jgi:hypothetical protein
MAAGEHHNRRSRSASAMNPSMSLNYGSQRGLFVVFEKKAGTIRLADAAVGEVDITDEPLRHHHHRSRASLDGSYMAAGSKGGHWIVPVRAELPLSSRTRSTTSRHHHGTGTYPVYLLTRGRYTYVMPAPLPANISIAAALYTLSWESTPSHVSARVCYRSPSAGQATAATGDQQLPPLLQLIGLGDAGIEVQELTLSTILSISSSGTAMNNTIGSSGLAGKGKGKSRLEEPIRTTYDLGGDTGFLCEGGHWHFLNEYDPVVHLTRSYSLSSDYSATAMSLESIESDEVRARMQMEQGIYAWCRKTAVDYRLFWLGGSGDANAAEQTFA